MPAAGRVDKLCGDPHTITGTADRAFEYRLLAKLAADRANIDRTPLVGEARVARDHHQAGDLRQVGDDVFADSVREIFLLRIPRNVGKWQNGDRRVRFKIGSVGLPAVGGGRVSHVRMPPPDPNRPVDVFDVDLAAVLEASVDPIADAFVDDRGDANAAWLSDWFKTRGDVHAIAVYGIDDARELNDGAIANQLHYAALVGSDGWLKNHLPVPLQSGKRAPLVQCH